LLIYKNGLLFNATKNIDGAFSTVYDNPARPIQVGYFYDFGSYFNLTNVGITQIYNRVLSPTEILQNYDATKKRYYPEENIVRDGLILNLDPGNSRSYAGAGNTIYDLAGFGNTGTLTNGPTFSTTNNGSIFFDGNNDYVDTKNTTILKSSPFTVSFWVNVNTFGANYGSNAVTQEYTLFGPVASYLGYTNTFMAGIQIASNGNAEAVVRESNFAKNKWYHYCSVYDGSAIGNTERLKVYIDGTQRSLVYDNTIPSTPSIRALSTFSLGYFVASGFNYFNGNVSQVLIYNKALSAQEVLQNYNSTKNRFINTVPPVRDNLILNLDAGDLASYPGSGTTWFDLSGNSLNGTLTNGPTFSFSDSSSSVVFDGTNDYASTTNTLFPDTGPFTVGLLYKITGTLGRGGIFERYEGGNFNGVSLGQGAPPGTDSWQFSVASNLNTGLILSYTYPSTNVWYHDVGVYNGSNEIKIYRNGVLVNSLVGTTQGNLSSGGARSFLVASRNLTSFLPCHINNITVYNRALSAAEILQNFNFYRSRYGI
jgi:hypothetical protein